MATLHPLPVFLRGGVEASAQFVANAIVGTAIPFRPGILNTERTGVLIDKIVFQVTSLDSPTAYLAPSPLAFEVRLQWRDVSITDSFVSIAAVAWPQNRTAEFAPYSGAVAVINLSRPFYLPPGDVIDVTMRNGLFYTANGKTCQVEVVAVGKQALAPPAARWVPYLCDYVGPVYAAGAEVADDSVPTDLGNPFDTPLLVERAVARVLTAGQPAGAPFTDFDQQTGLWSIRAQISDHRDNSWVPTPTPIGLVASGVDRSWILHHTIEPKGYLKLSFDGTMPNAGLGEVYRVVMGLVGYRRIA